MTRTSTHGARGTVVSTASTATGLAIDTGATAQHDDSTASAGIDTGQSASVNTSATTADPSLNLVTG